MTPHIAEARRAAAHLLWAAIAGGTAEEGVAIMHLCGELWPDKPLMLGKEGPFRDSPSAQQWTNAISTLELARAAQGLKLGINWDERAKAEALIDRALGKRDPEAMERAAEAAYSADREDGLTGFGGDDYEA